MHDDGVRTQANMGYGSCNTMQIELTDHIRAGRFMSILSGSYNRTDGPCADMDFAQYDGYTQIVYEVTED